MKRREDKAKKATVKEVSAVEETPAAAAAPAAAAPSAVLNFFKAVVPTQQPASYVFSPERFTEITEIFWKLTFVVDQASLQSTCADPKAIGHFVFDEATSGWKRGSCPIHWHKWPRGEWGWSEELLLVKCM